MKTYKVQKLVQTEKTTESFDPKSFDNLKDAETFFNEILAKQVLLAGEYNTGEFSEYYNETLEIESFDDESDDFETIKEVVVYTESLMDKNNYKGDYANNYWGIGVFDGCELVYNFYNNGKDMQLEYENIKESELKKWYNQ